MYELKTFFLNRVPVTEQFKPKDESNPFKNKSNVKLSVERYLYEQMVFNVW